ncbi:periplasmic heavy metal sensor [Pseudodesulfovibrio cashew]|uniref:Periplasmic heavy metal sensor n=1 Tax=Pseudodesulfovibrio cashew TaxID=2678688 RepID=A0A6I6JIE4_9BACT|nr:periplasmic heavy metal sensor [Pseudodesulfovibrio cashew]QGY40092.1 periplasmic heavy metal sensor [Pseudodesulfovibrio cashew]
MTKKNITITSLAAVLVLAMSAFAFAGPGYGRGGCGGPGYGQGAAYTQLTPEKQAAVDKIYEKYDGKFDELRTEMWTKRATLQAMINGGNADEGKIGKLTTDLTNLRDKMWDLRKSMSDELVKETGIEGFGYGYGRGACSGFRGAARSNGDCPGYGQGYGSQQGRGYGRGMGRI